MKKPIRWVLGLAALLCMLTSAVWAVSASAYGQGEALYTPLSGDAEERLLPFADAWRQAAAQGGIVTLQRDVRADSAPGGAFARVPEGREFVLNLNGHKLAGDNVSCVIYIGARGWLTVTGGEQGSGQITGVIGVDKSGGEDQWGRLEIVEGVKASTPVAMTLDAAQEEAPQGPQKVPQAPQEVYTPVQVEAQPNMAAGVPSVTAETGAQAEYTPLNGTVATDSGRFADMWNKAVDSGGGTVRLLSNVTALYESFGTGNGFDIGGAVYVPPAKQLL